ncbi:hypothetical protein HGG72_05400 [Ochrobactrum pecoris]|uniref:Uncharacterized protein n=1 Tax=Brucella pecoris TaxID=867683 RepID=A0A5C5CFB9_9HYPH|nr:hypothetical protein [Brucella pecoris]MBB4094062.1 hypothetical protein [Brucella pecoris]NKW79874.1 hypothetical protein [Brucella pecoris]TNV09436.1 hypothetical protein FIB18_20460 [Brucella pecoris]
MLHDKKGGTFINCVDWRTRAPSSLKIERHACKSEKAAPVRKHLSGKLFHDKTNIAGFGQKERVLSLYKEKGGRNRLF